MSELVRKSGAHVEPGRAALKETFGDRFEPILLDQTDARPGVLRPAHSVLTLHLADSGPTKAAEERTIAFIRKRLGLDVRPG